MIGKEHFLKAFKELRENKKRKFDQSVDLVINLKDYDFKKNPLNVSLTLPHPAKKIRICAFLENPTKVFDEVILKKDFDSLKENDLKRTVQCCNFCIAIAKLMPEIAKRFGRILGPTGKMPDPKMGCVVMNENEETLKKLSASLQSIIKIRAKESSIKVMIGKESISDEDLSENAAIIYATVFNALPKKKENIKNVMVKFTMSKPIKIKEKEK